MELQHGSGWDETVYDTSLSGAAASREPNSNDAAGVWDSRRSTAWSRPSGRSGVMWSGGSAYEVGAWGKQWEQTFQTPDCDAASFGVYTTMFSDSTDTDMDTQACNPDPSHEDVPAGLFSGLSALQAMLG